MDKRVVPFCRPDISEHEINSVSEALRSGWITTGPRTKLFERRLAAYIDTGNASADTEADPARWNNRVICLNSCTAAECLNFEVLGIKPGDEVIVPAYTYTATASAAIHAGARVVFVDIQKDGSPETHLPEMDYDTLSAAITARTKAVVPVDLGGVVCDYDRIFDVLDQKKALFTPARKDGTKTGDLGSCIQKLLGRAAVVSDSAHSLGAARSVNGTMKHCGAIADFTSFSFHAVKNFTTGEGGASAWNLPDDSFNAELYHLYQLLSLHGQDKDALAKVTSGSWEYDIIGPWRKCNMTDITAAIGLAQLDRYPDLIRRRAELIARYDRTCDELGISRMIHHTDTMHSSNHLYLIRIPGIDEGERNTIIRRMADLGVSVNVHYKPLPMMTAYKRLGWRIEDFPNAYNYYKNLITLPLHTLLTDEDADYVCAVLKKAVREIA